MKKSVLVLFALLFSLTCYAEDVTLQWDANTERDLAGYKIYRDGVKVGEDVLVGTETYIDAGLSDGDYYWNVTAFDTEGFESEYSNTVTKHINNPPDAPTGLRFWIEEIISWLKARFGRGLRVS